VELSADFLPQLDAESGQLTVFVERERGDEPGRDAECFLGWLFTGRARGRDQQEHRRHGSSGA
jgi:hypothetical protein